jgi:hypothetical protein
LQSLFSNLFLKVISKLSIRMKDPTFRRGEKVETKMDLTLQSRLLSSIQMDLLSHDGYIWTHFQGHMQTHTFWQCNFQNKHQAFSATCRWSQQHS